MALLENHRTIVLSDGYYNELSNLVWNVAIDDKQKNAVLILDDWVAKGNNTGVSEPAMQMVLAKVNSGCERDQSLTCFRSRPPTVLGE